MAVVSALVQILNVLKLKSANIKTIKKGVVMSEELQKTENINIIIDNELERLHLTFRNLSNYAITDSRAATKKRNTILETKVMEKVLERITTLENFLMDR